VSFNLKLINATVDNSAGNSLDPVPLAMSTHPPGAGVLENMLTDTGTAPTASGYVPPAGIPANGLPASVDRYPSFLNAMFDPDFTNYGPNGVPFDGDDVNGATPAVQPLARYVGNALIGGLAVELNLVLFGPGVLSTAFPAPHPYADLTMDMGYTTIAVWQDPTQYGGPTVRDNICTQLGSLATAWGEARTNPCNGTSAPPCGTTAGIIDPAVGANNGLDRYRTPPSAGTHLYTTYTMSQRDGGVFQPGPDGFETSIDTCPEATNMENPKVTAGADGDGIDPACDPTPSTDTGAGNHDGDVAASGQALINVADNCPLVANGTQLESEQGHSYYEIASTNPAEQGGPKADGIGDACDTDDSQANGDYLADIDVTGKCIGGTDGDGDGYCVSAGSGVLAPDPNDSSASIVPEDYDLVFALAVAHAGAGDNPPERQPVQVCNDGIDNDGDTLVDNRDHGGVSAPANLTSCRPGGLPSHPGYPACPVLGCAVDSDGDGFANEVERHVGTNPLGRCGIGTAGEPPSWNWPLDFSNVLVAPNSVDRITISDLTSFLAPRKLDLKPGDPGFDVRWDLVPGPGGIGINWININDLAAMFSGAGGFPPMTSGTKVFSTAFTCAAHPIFGY
jgi:hypothetical protein